MSDNSSETIYFVFDVESIGLHGEAFAVGWTIINGHGVEVQYGLASCDRGLANGIQPDRDWVNENVPLITSGIRSINPNAMRHHFWTQYISWKQRGAIFCAECSWPVEARFLAQCIDDDSSRNWEGPYPLHDIASIIFAKGEDPMAKNARLSNELPEHNPLADARQSARLMIEALNS